MSDSSGFKPQAVCSAAFASPDALPAGDGGKAPVLFPHGMAAAAALEFVCSRWAVCISCQVGGRKHGWRCRMFLWQVDGLAKSSGLRA